MLNIFSCVYGHLQVFLEKNVFRRSLIIFFNVFYFIFESEKERESKQGKGRERGTQNPKQPPGSELSEPDMGLQPMNCEIMTRAEVRYLSD